MKHITGYWIDEFNNRWNEILFTEEQAEAESKTLKNCSKLGGRDGKRNEIEN